MSKIDAHDSYYVWLIFKFKAVGKLAPLLRGEKTRGEFILFAIILGLAAIGSVFSGYYVETQVIHPPLQVVGVCLPPAQITPSGCFKSERTFQIVNGVNTSVIAQVPAGYLLLPNGTAH